MDDDLEVRRLGPGDEAEVAAAGALFDRPPAEAWTRAFLEEPTHHLLLASRASGPVGFVTGVEMVHPDKGREMFVYELSVAPAWRRRGIAKALLRALEAIARERDCYDMWVLTDIANTAAKASYASTGAERVSAHIMFEWRFDRPPADPA